MEKAVFLSKIYSLRKKIYFLYQERLRIERLKRLEKELSLSGYHYIAGIDEVGRGALAGPVVAAAVVIKEVDSFFVAYLKDSKKINKIRREYVSQLISDKLCDIGIGLVDADTIDRINIAQSTFLAMKRALRSLEQYPDYILVDAFKIPYILTPQDNLIRGEDKSISIAAASVIAKVYRDGIMRKFHEKYPLYQFNKNMGYGTKNHLEAIKENGISPIHRKTFKGVIIDKYKEIKYPKQKSLYE
ncbi:MAG: ribonuclease HII [Candidatus Atribacteria bacterium]|nr:ribonuclease HII [Candidatus Atribacteria bacterium]